MKFAAVILLACVAASSAAFTGNLVEQSKPVIDRAIFGLRLAVSSNANKGPIQDLINEVITNLQNQLNDAIQHVQENVVPGLQAQLQAQVENLQNQLANVLAMLHGQVTGSLANLLAMLGLGQGTKAVSLTSIIAQLNELVAVAQFHIANAQDQLAAFLTPENIRQMLMNAIDQIVPESLKPAVLAAFGLNVNNKGWLTDLIGGWFGGVWDGISGIISQNINTLVAELTDLVGQVQAGATQAMAQLRQVVKAISAMIAAGKDHISVAMAEAIQTIIQPAMGELGEAGQTLWQQLADIIAGGKH